MYRRPKCEILIVEDNPADIRLMKEAIGTSSESRLHVCANGAEALEFLRRQKSYTSVPRPNIVLLDLNLPQIDGREVLRQVKSDDSLRTIPVLVLSTSESQRDINMAYQLGASCFLTKPQDLDGFFALMRSIHSFWAQWTVYPGEPGRGSLLEASLG